MFDERIISKRKAQKLIRKEGLFAIDGHAHSSASYDVVEVPEMSPANIARVQMQRGLYPLISDHDTMDGSLYLIEKDVNIIPASEITIKPEKARKVKVKPPFHTLHITVSDLDVVQFKDLMDIANNYKDMDMFMDYIKENDLKAPFNHPFFCERGEIPNHKAIPYFAQYFDVLEISNSPKKLNDLTLRMAQEFNKGIISTSDSHTGRTGIAYSLADANNYDEYWEKVKAGENYLVRKDLTPFEVKKETKIRVHQLASVSKDNMKIMKEKGYKMDLGVAFVDYLVEHIVLGNSTISDVLRHPVIHTFHYVQRYMGKTLGNMFSVKPANNYAKRIESDLENTINNIKNGVIDINNLRVDIKTLDLPKQNYKKEDVKVS